MADIMAPKGWGLYPWFRESGVDLVHPEDLATVQAHSPYCLVCEVVGQDGEYLVLRYGAHQFRGKPRLFDPVPPPAFRVGQWVRTVAPRTIKVGVVRAIGWHYRRNEPSYFLYVDGVPLKSRYWATELYAVPGEPICASDAAHRSTPDDPSHPAPLWVFAREGDGE